jgi:hypothetical protein
MQHVTFNDDAPAIDDEYIGACEDRIARKITASEQVNGLRQLMARLHKRQMLTTVVYYDACDALTYIDGELLDGKQAVATLRNARRRKEAA